MFLALCIGKCEDALICDLAETYHIFNYRALQVSLLATLSYGLRDDSRVKIFFSDIKVTTETMLLACAVDHLSFLSWAKTEDAQKGRNRPKSVVQSIMQKEEESTIQAYENGYDFENAWANIVGGI